MIPIPSGVRVWIATGHTDMRRGLQGLALTVQEQLKRDPHAGDLYIFSGHAATSATPASATALNSTQNVNSNTNSS
jgi:transposase